MNTSEWGQRVAEARRIARLMEDPAQKKWLLSLVAHWQLQARHEALRELVFATIDRVDVEILD